MSEVHMHNYQNNKLRLKYQPQQMNYHRATKAQTICEEGGFINVQA